MYHSFKSHWVQNYIASKQVETVQVPSDQLSSVQEHCRFPDILFTPLDKKAYTYTPQISQNVHV